jgi:hypothetical protein
LNPKVSLAFASHCIHQVAGPEGSRNDAAVYSRTAIEQPILGERCAFRHSSQSLPLLVFLKFKNASLT